MKEEVEVEVLFEAVGEAEEGTLQTRPQWSVLNATN